ncbi:hypothetical protein AB1N83_009555 [Pleurotus pulmonarius]
MMSSTCAVIGDGMCTLDIAMREVRPWSGSQCRRFRAPPHLKPLVDPKWRPIGRGDCLCPRREALKLRTTIKTGESVERNGIDLDGNQPTYHDLDPGECCRECCAVKKHHHRPYVTRKPYLLARWSSCGFRRDGCSVVTSCRPATLTFLLLEKKFLGTPKKVSRSRESDMLFTSVIEHTSGKWAAIRTLGRSIMALFEGLIFNEGFVELNGCEAGGHCRRPGGGSADAIVSRVRTSFSFTLLVLELQIGAAARVSTRLEDIGAWTSNIASWLSSGNLQTEPASLADHVQHTPLPHKDTSFVPPAMSTRTILRAGLLCNYMPGAGIRRCPCKSPHCGRTEVSP